MAPTLSATTSPAQARSAFRTGDWDRVTTGLCAGYFQANMAILPSGLAAEFEDFCGANPSALPLLEVTEPGRPDALSTAQGADLRTDLPRYRIYREGVMTDEPTSVTHEWRDDLVAFLLGCSFSAEQSLLDAGVRLRHLDEGISVPIFRTSMPCTPVGRFHGPVVVSMRAIDRSEVDTAAEVTSKIPLAHGGPIHIGDPSRIGITDLSRPEWGEALTLQDNEVPVFWACGVTPQAVLMETRPEFAITHSPGHMFITDLLVDELSA